MVGPWIRTATVGLDWHIWSLNWETRFLFCHVWSTKDLNVAFHLRVCGFG
jgi:hypothetical protein